MGMPAWQQAFSVSYATFDLFGRPIIACKSRDGFESVSFLKLENLRRGLPRARRGYRLIAFTAAR
jgi:hypothetical protein